MVNTKNMSRDHVAVLQQLSGLSGISFKALLSDQPRARTENVAVDPVAVSAIILEELSLTLSTIVNFIPEVELLRAGRIYDAYTAVIAKCAGLTVVDPVTAWAKAQAKASVSKLLVPGVDPLPPSIKLWWADEHRCYRTNSKLDAWVNRYTRSLHDPLVHLPKWFSEVLRMREFISYALGETPDVSSIVARAKYGPGTSVLVRGDATHYASKLTSWDVSPGSDIANLAVDSLALDKAAWELLGFDPRESTNPSAIEGFKREARKNLMVVPHDRLLFVFKNATALRTITVQSTLAGMIQLGVDAEMKGLLKKVGLDLTDQSINVRLAHIGSRDWNSSNPWCTVDFSSASNLIAKRLIAFLFPRAWSRLLWTIRSSSYTTPPEMGGSSHTYQMYAGMGNGTTFPVESLIFAAMAYAVGDYTEPSLVNRHDRHFNVYGDDVVIRRASYRSFIALAEYFGFRVNENKSFSEGPFRESCGADFWDGINIRPTYVRGDQKLNEIELVGVHNTLMDSKFFVLQTAAKRIRALWRKTFPWPLPSDPIGGLGFRTCGAYAWEFVGGDKPSYSTLWHRPRHYLLQVTPVKDVLSGLSSHAALNVALLGGTQDCYESSISDFSLPFRRAIKIRVVPERDLCKEDAVTMLVNQLKRLAQRKGTAWWNPSRGK